MAKTEDGTMTPEWSHMVRVDELEGATDKVSITADEAERALLAQRLAVLSVDEASADMSVSREAGGLTVHVKGVLKAKITQSCVVTTDPVESVIEEAFEGWFADSEQAVSFAKAKHDRAQEKGQNELPVLSEQDDPEGIVDGEIDVGELVTQHLSLFIDLYPHAEGANYEHGDDAPQSEAAAVRKNPFAALKDWKAKQEGDGS